MPLGVPEGFYVHLLDEDDWSFVIKTSAFLEATCSHILVKRLAAPELVEAFGHIDQGNLKFGKIVLLKELGSITSAQAGILQRVASLRNELVHNISNISFSFSAYIARLSDGERKGLLKQFGHGVADHVPGIVSGMSVTRDEFVVSNPKEALWLTTAEIVACLEYPPAILGANVLHRADENVPRKRGPIWN